MQKQEVLPLATHTFTPYIPQETDEELKNYKPRKSYLDILEILFQNKISTLLTGEAGTGKTSLFRFLAMQKSLPFLPISCDFGLSAREQFGTMHLKNGETVFKEGLLTKFTQFPSIILLDEVNALDASKSFILHQLFSERRFFVKDADGEGKMYEVHPDVWFVAAGNPPTGKYTGTNRYNVAFLSRFAVVEMENFTNKELSEILGDGPLGKQLRQFYEEANAIIHKQTLRATFTLRDLRRIGTLLEQGMIPEQAVKVGMANGLKLLTNGEGFEAIMGIAKAIFPIKPKEKTITTEQPVGLASEFEKAVAEAAAVGV